MGIGLMCSSARVCLAQNDKPGDIIVQRVDIVDADLQQAIALLKVQTGVEIIIESSEKPYGRVTMTLTNRPLEYVLNKMCSGAGASCRVENGVYIVGPKDAAPIIAPAPPSDPKEPVAPLKMRIEKIQLRNSRPTEILYLLGLNQGYLNDAIND